MGVLVSVVLTILQIRYGSVEHEHPRSNENVKRQNVSRKEKTTDGTSEVHGCRSLRVYCRNVFDESVEDVNTFHFRNIVLGKTHTYTRTHTYVHTHMNIYTYIRTRIHMYTYACMYVIVYVCK